MFTVYHIFCFLVGGPGILLAESQKGLKKSWKTGRTKKVLRKTGRNICAGNQKMPFLSRGHPEKLENMAETGKHNLKFAETAKVFLEAAESRKSPKRQRRVAETWKSEKSHGKPEKVGISWGKPETDPLFPAPCSIVMNKAVVVQWWHFSTKGKSRGSWSCYLKHQQAGRLLPIFYSVTYVLQDTLD